MAETVECLELAPVGEQGVYEPPGLTISVEAMLRIQGYTDLGRVRRPIQRAAQAMAARAGELAEPSVHYLRVPIASCAGGVLALECGPEFHCPAFDQYVGGSREAVVFILTLGPAMDAATHDFSDKGQLLEALFLHAAGWMGVESATRSFVQGVRGFARANGLKQSRRMSPGYTFVVGGEKVEWLLDEQRPLFELFDHRRLPVDMTEGCAMIPSMSRSGLLGLRVLDPEAGASAPAAPA